MTSTPAIVSAQWLNALLDAGAKIRVLDVTFSKEKDFSKDYESGHIPGALYFNLMRDVENTPDFPWNIPTAAAFQKQARELGVDDDTHVVVYDNGGNCGYGLASRVWWLFRLYGHGEVSVLDGAMKAWVDTGYPISDKKENPQAGNMRANYDPALYRCHDDLVKNQTSHVMQIIDTRSPGLFNGKKEDKKSGHIPGAVNIPFATELPDHENNRFKTKDELLKVFSKAGVDCSKPLVMMCTSGRGSCAAVLAAYVCGNEQAALYLGGFTDWKNHSSEENIEQS